EEGAAAGEDDAAVHDVGGELGRSLVQGRLDRVDDLRDRILERVANLLAREDYRLREAGEHVSAADLRLNLFLQRVGGADLELDLLGGLLADPKFALALCV